MTSPLDPTLAALAGSTLGGLTTLAVTWIAQRTQLRATLAARDRTTREKLYKQFIEEASKLFGDALVSNTLEIPTLIGAYALINRIRVVSSAETVEKAEVVLRAIINLYSSPNRTVADLRADLNEHKLDVLRDFSSAARDELLNLQY